MTTRIIHISMAAKNPERAARILADVSSGDASRFRAKGMPEGAWVCIWEADRNELVEFIPEGFSMVPGHTGAAFRSGHVTSGYGSTHVQVEVDTPLAKIKAVADANGCRHYFRPASGGPLYEVWIEDQLLVELVSDEIRHLPR